MKIVTVGLNHNSAPLDLREKVTLGKEELPDALTSLRDTVSHGVILSTCNRSEIYAVAPTVTQGTQALKQFFAEYHKIDLREFEPHMYVHHQRSAVHHLFRVASGLDSLIVGEAQILGQTRDAFSAATRAGLGGGQMARLFHQAIRVGRLARQKTDIGRNAVSVSRAAVSMARGVLGDLADKRVLVIGIGDAGRLASRALADAGVTDITITNRTYKRAAEMASKLGGKPAPFEDLDTLLGQTDIAIAATGSPGYLLTPDVLAASRNGNEQPLFMMDIAMPRDVDPAVGDLPGVNLYDMDDLEAVAEANKRKRRQEATKAEAIVDEEADRFMQWLSSQYVIPTVAGIRAQAEEVRKRELARILKEFPQLSQGERAKLAAFSNAMVKKVLHGPISWLKDNGDPTQVEVARKMFGLPKDV